MLDINYSSCTRMVWFGDWEMQHKRCNALSKFTGFYDLIMYSLSDFLRTLLLVKLAQRYIDALINTTDHVIIHVH